MKLRVYADVKYFLSLKNAPLTNIVYCLTFPNNKKYIGKTTNELEYRIKQHIRNSFLKDNNFNNKKENAIRKYMEFKVEVLYQGNDLDEQEIKFISEFETIKNGYNILTGGDGGYNELKCKSVLQYDLNMNLINEFKSLKEAALSISKIADYSKISLCASGKRKTAYKYIWKFKNK